MEDTCQEPSHSPDIQAALRGVGLPADFSTEALFQLIAAMGDLWVYEKDRFGAVIDPIDKAAFEWDPWFFQANDANPGGDLTEIGRLVHNSGATLLLHWNDGGTTADPIAGWPQPPIDEEMLAKLHPWWFREGGHLYLDLGSGWRTEYPEFLEDLFVDIILHHPDYRECSIDEILLTHDLADASQVTEAIARDFAKSIINRDKR